MTDRVRIAIIDDHPLYLEGLVSSLRRFADLEIVSVGATADAALQAAQSSRVDILLLDIDIPGNGIEAAKRIALDNPAVKVLMLTGSNSEDVAADALATGARGYVLKGATGRELANIIRTVHRGEPFVSPSLASRMLMQHARDGSRSQQPQLSSPARPDLNSREKEVLHLAAQGLKNHEIAKMMGLSVSAIKHHISRIVKKWGVRTRVEAIVIHTQNKETVASAPDPRRRNQS